MSMTTEDPAAGFAGSMRRRLVAYLRRAALLVIVVFCWLGLLLALTLVAEPTREVVIWSPGSGKLMRVIEQAPVSLIEIPGRGVVVRGDEAGYVARLYGAGAWLVLPARRGVCGERKARVRPIAPEAQTFHDSERGPAPPLPNSHVKYGARGVYGTAG